MRPIVLAFSLSLLAACGGPPPQVVAIVDLQRAMNESQGGAAARAQLRTMFQARQAELDRRQAQLQAESAQLDAQIAQHADVSAAQARMQTELQQLQNEYVTDQHDLEAAEQQMTGEIITRMTTLIEELRASHGVDIVLESNETGLVAHAPRVVDLTSALVTLYDQRFPASPMSAIAPAPGTVNGAQVVH